MTKAVKSHINCSEMLNVGQKHKHCNRLVIIPWRNTILFQKLIGDHFRVHVKRNGDHFAVLDFQKKILGPAGPQVFVFGHQNKYSR